jgi:hypothetical protein
MEVAVLTDFVGRAGDTLLDDVEGFCLEGVLGGVEFTALRLAFSAARWGSGLIGRDPFSDGEQLGATFLSNGRSSFSSSELKRLREPVRGEGGFEGSTTTDLGRNLGNADADPGFLGRSEDEGLVAPTPTESRDFVGGSSIDDLCKPADTLRRVTVLESGVPARFNVWDGDLMSPIEVRGVDGLRLIALRRRELGLLGFLTVLSGPRVSLFITSAKALPARFKECLIELLVEGFARGLALGATELESLFM